MGAEPAYLRHYDDNDPDEIREQIERTRAHMTQTVDHIQERLSPEQIKQQAQDAIYDATLGKVENMAHTAQDTAQGLTKNLAQTIRENPMPALLTGVGLAWLFASSGNSGNTQRQSYYRQSYSPGYQSGSNLNSHDYYAQTRAYGYRDEQNLTDEARAKLQQAQQQARQTAQKAQDQAHNMAAQAQDQVQNLTHQTREQMEQAQQWTQQMQYEAQQQAYQAKQGFYDQMEQNPLMVGAIALGVGALIGLSLPSTPTENRYFGETRDHLVEQVQETAQEVAHQVKEVAVEAKDAAIQTAKHEADKVSLAQTDSTDEALEKAKTVVTEAKDAAFQTAESEANRRDIDFNSGSSR